MKRLIVFFVAFTTINAVVAQKQVTFNGKSITINGEIVATHQYVYNGINDGVKDIYSNFDPDLKILTITELNTDKR